MSEKKILHSEASRETADRSPERICETNCFAGGIELKKEPYRRVPFGEEWKVNLAEELLATKAGDLEVTNISNNNLDSILEDVCCC